MNREEMIQLIKLIRKAKKVCARNSSCGKCDFGVDGCVFKCTPTDNHKTVIIQRIKTKDSVFVETVEI